MPTRVPPTLPEFHRATPVIINVADLSARVNRLRAPLLVHFTGDQLKKAFAGARRAPKDAKVPKGGLHVHPIPFRVRRDWPGDNVVYPNCGTGCVAVPRYEKKDGTFTWVCDCPRPAFAVCKLVYSYAEQTWGCIAGLKCPKGCAFLYSWPDDAPNWTVWCACKGL